MSIKNILLAQTLDALFPVGGYTLSNGMETYTQYELVTDYESLFEHISSYLYMLRFNEPAFAARAYKGGDITLLDNLYSAAKSPSELREGSMKQCARFLKIHTGLKDYKLLKDYREKIKSGYCDGHYCLAMGLFICELDADLELSLELYCFSIISAMVNHAVKLVPLKQMDGQRVLFEAASKIPETVQAAINVKDNELGVSGCGFDIRSMQHEQLYSRLYIS